MKRSLLLILLSAVSALLFHSCKEKKTAGAGKDVAQQVAQLKEVVSRPSNNDSLLKAWKRLESNSVVQKDTALDAEVKYYIGRLYAMKGSDSSRLYIERALERIEPTSGNFETKTLLYNGMGNIWSVKAKEHQAGYYYNKAAALIMADTGLDLSPETRSIMLLSAAQSNTHLYQYDLATKMNLAALALDSLLPPKHINRQRVLVQIIQTMNVRHQSPDSIAPYLSRLEALHHRYPGNFNDGYLYECKALYFVRMNLPDSVLYYTLQKAALDEAHFRAEGAAKAIIDNLFIDYVNVGESYVALKQKTKAASAMQQAQQLLNQYPERISVRNLILYKNNLAGLYELQGRPQDALKLMNETYELQRAMYRSENIQAVAEMHALYQLQAKDRSILSLNEHIRINQLELQQNRLWLIIAILVVVLLVLGLVFLYYSYRQRRAGQEKEKTLLQQQLLRTQMEPHFIFNTLSALQSFVRLDRKDDAIRYLHRFSRLLRSSLELSRENLVPLEDEIETLENYLSLQQMRFENAFQYTIHRPEEQDLGAVMLPPMLIQPYVENAILHGIDLGGSQGSIDIRFRLEGDLLEITITDSGKTESKHTEPAHRSLSGTISRERLNLLGKRANVATTPAANGGTTVILHIPITL